MLTVKHGDKFTDVECANVHFVYRFCDGCAGAALLSRLGAASQMCLQCAFIWSEENRCIRAMETTGHNRCNVQNEEVVLEATLADVGYHSDYILNEHLSECSFILFVQQVQGTSLSPVLSMTSTQKLQVKLMLCAMYCGVTNSIAIKAPNLKVVGWFKKSADSIL
jgi:hypothetical protein